MRLERLRLLAYGPFTSTDVPLAPTRLNVVFGPNEAGKSTALRAIDALLYGFETRTADNYLHENRRLRVGGTLSAKSGASFEYVRRKSNKDTVLDPRGENPIDDAPLAAMLSGTGREAFRAIFGLDHARLREGGQTLLEGGGNVGESLFSASMGVVPLHHVLAELDAEAEAIHAQRRGHALGKVLDEYDRLRGEAASAAISGDVVHEQRTQYENEAQNVDALRARTRELERERARLVRITHVWQKLPEHLRIVAQLAELGAPAAVDPPAREAAERDLISAEPALERLEKDLSRTLAQRAAIDLPAPLLAASEEIERLWTERGAYLKAASDQKAKKEELAALVARAREHAGHLGADVAALDASPGALKKLRRAHEDLLRAETELEASSARVRATAPATPATNRPETGLAAIDAALAMTKGAPALTASADAAERERAGLVAKVQSCLPALGIAPDWKAALRLEAPAQEAAHAALEAQRPVAERLSAIERRAEEYGRLAREKTARGAELRARAPVPDEGDLRRARAERDALIDRWARGEPAATEVARAVARADGISDEMRAEAATVSEIAALDRDAAQGAEGAAQARAELEPARQELARLRAGWNDRWAEAGLTPRAPEEAISWLHDFTAAHTSCTRIVELDATIEHDRAKLDTMRADLAATAQGAGLATAKTAGVEALVDALRARRELIAGDRRAAEDAEKARGEAARDLAAARERLEAAQTAWQRLAGAAGLRCSPTTADTDPALAELEAFVKTGEKADDLRKRLRDIDRDAAALFGALASLVRTVAPDLEPGRIESLETLYKRYTEAAQLRRVATKLDADAQALHLERDAARAKADEARAVLARLVAAVGVRDVAALREAEERTLRIRQLGLARDERQADLANLSDGLGLDDLRREAGEFTTLDDVRGRLADIEEQHQRAAADLESARTSAAGLEARLRAYNEPLAHAADALTDAQASLSRARDLGERWVRLRLAHEVLRRAVDGLRAASQGPVVARAGELFRALTLGAFARLEVDVGERDEPVLLAVREGGASIGTTGLSDGTRDQLYLALWVASLERTAAHSDPLPLVLDDVLVDFDDDRARAALAVLGTLAKSMQVLLFTHHARIVELAHEAVPEVAIAVLPSASGAPAA